MAYTTERAGLIAKQLERFAHSQPHQLAGQAANLDFWLDEAASALALIDDYAKRFRRLRDAQVAWVSAHDTRVSEYCPHCGGTCEVGPETPAPPRRIPSEEMEAARRDVRQAVLRLLQRCHRMRLVDEPTVRTACERLGINLEPEDLER